MYTRKILLSALVLVCLIAVMSGCAPIMPAPTIERVIVPLARDGDRDSPKVYYYWVRTGDTLYAISQLHGLSVDQIAQMNEITAPYVIHPGQRLVVDRGRLSQSVVANSVTPKARVTTSDISKSSSSPPARTSGQSRVADTGVQVTKLPRPALPPSANDGSKAVTNTGDRKSSQAETASKPSDAKSGTAASVVANKPPPRESVSQSTTNSTVAQSPNKRAPVATEPLPPRQVATTQNNPTKQEVEQLNLPAAEKQTTPSFVARTEPSNIKTGTSSQADINSLPKGWSWPVTANPTNSFGKDDGLNYYLNQGNKVSAAASGRVTYAGVALSDFKYMVLIKTPDEYVIQYDFNVDLTVQENDLVSKGQELLTIANSSNAKHHKDSDEYRKVFFAIRKKGVPQNPTKLIGAATSREI